MLPTLPLSPVRGLVALAAAWLAAPVLAVVIDTGDGSGNTTPPVDDFGFENVGVTSNNLSGIYLGDGWVLTANHVGEKPITVLGTVYSPVPGSGTRLSNPSGGTAPDLYVYRVDGFPNVPAVVLSNATPTIGEEVSCSGHGWNREASATSWNSSWEEQGEPGASPPFVYDGFKKGSGRERRWGRNEVAGVGDVAIGSSSITRSLTLVFDETQASPDEFQAVAGDSGGGCFAKRSGTWELVGVSFAMSVLFGQPADTAVFGNQSLAADVFHYRDEIEALTPPPGEVPAIGAWGAAVLALTLAGVARRSGALRG